MYALAVRQADGRVKIEMGDEIHLDPINGGFISLQRYGSSIGFPLGYVEDVRHSSQFEMLTENQKSAIALGKVQRFQEDKLQRILTEWKLDEDEVQMVRDIFNELKDYLSPEKERPVLNVKANSR